MRYNLCPEGVKRSNRVYICISNCCQKILKKLEYHQQVYHKLIVLLGGEINRMENTMLHHFIYSGGEQELHFVKHLT